MRRGGPAGTGAPFSCRSAGRPGHRILGGVTLATDIRQGVLRALADLHVPGRAVDESVAAELERFAHLMRDYPTRPGKTLRGQLLVWSARANGAANGGAAMILAEAIELFQNWVLVHDDIEDDSEERRGLPALHKQVGVPVALNVGDAMHMLMWRRLSDLPDAPPVDKRAALDEFTNMLLATAAGQHLDLAWVSAGRFDVTESEYLQMVTLKTAYYTVVAPLRLGAYCAGATPPAALESAAVDLGVAFQIRDDILNLGPGEGYGKEVAGDLYEGKRTLILAHLLANLRPAERKRVIGLLARPRGAKTAAEMDEVLQLMRERGSLDHAQRVAEERAARGLEGVRAWLARLPDQAAASRVAGLLGDLADRSA